MNKHKDEHIERLVETMPQNDVLLTNENREWAKGRELLNETYECTKCGTKLNNVDLLNCGKENCPRNIDMVL